MLKEQVQAICSLADLQFIGVAQIENDYWPKHPNYNDMREKHPWWNIVTTEGVIRIGRRKRVIEIDWSETKRRGIITKDDVTKSDSMVHAWNIGEVVTYLSRLKTLPIQEVTNPDDRVFNIKGIDDISSVLRTIGAMNMTGAQRAVIDLFINPVMEEGEVILRLVRNGDYYTMKLKTAKTIIEIQP